MTVVFHRRPPPALVRFRARVASLLAFGVVAAGVVGCGAGDRPAARGFEVRDSAGIRIAESGGPAWTDAEPWRLDPEPVLTLGGEEGGDAQDLYQVTSVLRLDGGRLLVANNGTAELRVYGPDRRLRSIIGRRGAGPGEFETLFWVGRYRADSLAVFDLAAQRISVYDADLRFARAVRLDGLGFAARFLGVYDDGSFLIAGGFDPARLLQLGAGRHRMDTRYHHMDFDGNALAELGPYPGDETSLRMQGGTSLSFGTGAFARQTYTVVRPDRYYVADNATGRVTVHAPAGQRIEELRVPWTFRPIDRRVIERHIEREVADLDPDARDTRRRELEAEDWPETMPAFDAMTVDAEGNLWIREYRWPPDEESRWRVFDETGRWLGTVTVPPRVRVLTIGEDYLIGVYHDPLEIEQIRIFALVKM